MKRFNKIVWKILIPMLCLGGSFLFFEALFRITGEEPWRPAEISVDFPRLFVSDAVAGWKNRPGIYEIPSPQPGVGKVAMHIDDRGCRVSGAMPESAPRTVMVTGGSNVLGWELADDQTFVWKLNERFPEAAFVNLSSAGYSTYQSFLVLKQYVETYGIRPDIVIYGFDRDQIERNVGAPSWTRLAARAARGGEIAIPYCRLSGETDTLSCFPPEAYPNWPLKRYSALITAAETLYMTLRHGEAVHQQDEVTRLLIQDMANWCKERGILFFVALMYLPSDIESNYKKFLDSTDIPYVDCSEDWVVAPAFATGPGGHPNEAVHDHWAECIGAMVQEMATTEKNTESSIVEKDE